MRILPERSFAGVRVLVMGLGLHGGGAATARWLARRGARVTVTDLRDHTALAPSLVALRSLPIRFVLGRHEEKDFLTHDLIVVNPGVPRESPYLAIAKKAKKRIENDASLFYSLFAHPTIAVTGTRGKTTTTLWIAELLKKKYPQVRPSGNTPENALLKEFDRIGKNTSIPAVSELSSWQLEFLPAAERAPHIAVITNLYRDHLNRYGGKMEAYADAKANIFLNQEPHDALILNRDNLWWRYFMKKTPRGHVFFTSTKPLPSNVPGLFIRGERIIFRNDAGKEQTLPIATRRFLMERGGHNLMNLLEALLAALLFDPEIHIHNREIMRLPVPRMREEIIARRGRAMIVNDSCATSPDGTIAAIKRFRNEGRIILVAGGTDKDLDFRSLAKTISANIAPERLFLLGGSATEQLHRLLPSRFSRIPKYDTLEECVENAFLAAKREQGASVILFSPGAASFEKFKHEFDRGEQFHRLVMRQLKRKKTDLNRR